MELNVLTLIVVLSLILGTQVIALFVQYKVNKSYKGIGYWLIGSSLMAIGFVIMPLVTLKSVESMARIANPILVLGHICLYIGIKRFISKKFNKWIPISIFTIFNIFYYYYMIIDNNMLYRTIVISFVLSIISFMIAYELFFKREKPITDTANFTGSIFAIYGCFYTIRIFLIESLAPTDSYVYQGTNLISAVIISIIISNLWTLGFIMMVNERLNIENKLEKEKLQLIFNTSIDAQLITRLEDGFIVDVNDEFINLSGYPKEEIIGHFMKDIWYDPSDRNLFTEELKDKGYCKNMEFPYQKKDGSSFTGLISAKVMEIHSETHIVSVIRDITERKKSQDALVESEEKYRSILNASPDDITITDLKGCILMVSPAAKRIFGYDSDFEGFVGMKLLDFIVEEDVDRAKSNIEKMCRGSRVSTTEYRAMRKDKSILDIEVNSGIIYNASGLADKMVFIIRDISKRKRIELEMKELIEQLEIERNTAQLNAITDSLTGLYNRGYFDKTLRMEFSRLNRSGSMLSLIMLDIDHFKKYNDTYGHLEGDRCIQLITSKLKDIIKRKPDLAARYGGEEFIAILPETDEEGARLLGEKIRKEVENLAIPHKASETSKHVTVSVGVVTVYPAHLESPDQALKLVDEALYEAKGKGRNQLVFLEQKSKK